MCGRYALFTLSPELIETVLGWLPLDEHGLLLPRWNIAPTQQAPVFRTNAEGRRALDPLRWGLVPSWAPDLKFGAKTINARAETAAGKPAFRSAFRARRCLVPVTGFYEWRKDSKPKQPYFIRSAASPVLLFAGLWESWTDKTTGEIVESFTILTTEAAGDVAKIHDRMPVVLTPERWSAWLDPALRDAVAAEKLLHGPATELHLVPIGFGVNNARNEGPDLVTPLPEDAPPA